MVDVWKELGLALGRALRPLADLAAGVWKSLGESAGDLAEGFVGGAQGVGEAVEPLIDPLLDGVLGTAEGALGEDSPRPELKEASDKLTKELMEMFMRHIPEKGESPPSLAALSASVAGIVGANIAMYVATYGVTMGLDLVHPVKEMGFRRAGKDLLDSFYMPSAIGPALSAPMWSGVIAPLRLRSNQAFPYAIPGTTILPYLRTKGLIDVDAYHLNMKFHALDTDWADLMLENVARYPSFSELRTMIHRTDLTWEDAKTILSKSMMHADYVDRFNQLVPSIPGVSDLVRFAVREAYPDAETFEEHYAKMTEWIARQGYDKYFADAFWTAHWVIPTPSQADDLLHRGEITEVEHTGLYILNDIRPEDIPNLRKLTWALPGRIEARWMYRYGEIDVSGLRDLLVKDGLGPDYADRVARAVAKNQYLTEINRERDNIKADFVKGYIVDGEMRRRLDSLGVRPEMVEYHALDAIADRDRAVRDKKLATLRKQYTMKILTMAEVMTEAEAIIKDPTVRDAWIAALPTDKEVLVVEETYNAEVNRLITNAKSDYVKGYIDRDALIKRLKMHDVPDEVVKYHVMDAEEDRTRKHNDRQLAIVEEGYLDDVITWESVESWARSIIKDGAARELYLDEVWLNKTKAVRVAASE